MNKVISKQVINSIDYIKFLFSFPKKDWIDIFNGDLKKFTGTNLNPLILGRARIGIYLLIKISITKNKKKVILSSYTIPDVINMVIMAGGEPIFVDVMAKSTNIDVNQLEKLIDNQVACVLITHYHVNQGEFESIKKMCSRYGVKLYEDCAISFGASYKNIHVGLDSDGGILSFSGFKFLNFLWGGAVITNREEVSLLIQKEIYCWKSLSKFQYLTQFKKIFTYDFFTRDIIFNNITFPIIKYNQKKHINPVEFSLPRIETSGLEENLTSTPHPYAYYEWNKKLKSIAVKLMHRRKIANIYNNYFSDIKISKETSSLVSNESGYVNYPIYIEESKRDKVYKEIILNNIDVGLSLYPACSMYSNFSSINGYSDNTEKLVKTIITLPTHSGVTHEYANYISSKILKLI